MTASVRNVKSRKKKAVTRPVPVRAAVHFEVKPLNPLQKCGAGTSVERLFKVVEHSIGHATSHLVFLDRHGWYCEHGRDCAAVAAARKYRGPVARAS